MFLGVLFRLCQKVRSPHVCGDVSCVLHCHRLDLSSPHVCGDVSFDDPDVALNSDVLPTCVGMFLGYNARTC